MPVEIHEITGWTFGPLTHELRDPQSPVRRLFATRFTQGAGGVQDRFKASVPAMMVPRATSDDATLGTAAGWLLRYLVYPAVDYSLARTGAEFGLPDSRQGGGCSSGWSAGILARLPPRPFTAAPGTG